MCRYGSRLPAIYRLRVYESADIGQCRVVEAIGLRTLDHSWRGGNIQTENYKNFSFSMETHSITGSRAPPPEGETGRRTNGDVAYPS